MPLPHDEQTERAVIGAILSGGNDTFDTVADMLTGDMFVDETCRAAYEAAVQLSKSGDPIDLITVSAKAKGKASIAEIAAIASEHLLSHNVEKYASTLTDYYLRRRIIDRAVQLSRDAYDYTITAEAIINGLEANLKEIADATLTSADAVRIGELLAEALTDMYKRNDMRRTGNTAVSGITTGLSRLDAMTQGWQNGELVVLAARPAMGKTALMLHYANAAEASGNAALIFSLEMSTKELADRQIVKSALINASAFRDGTMTDFDVNAVEGCVDRINKMRIYVDDNPSATTARIRRVAKRMKAQGRCDIVFVDYLQLITENTERGRNREQAVSAMTRDLKILAKELDLPVVLLSQLSRECESRADKKPELRDLRESGAIEQDADRVMFIYRPSVYGIVDGNTGLPAPEDKGYILLRKNRKGIIGSVPFWHNESLTIIKDY